MCILSTGPSEHLIPHGTLDMPSYNHCFAFFFVTILREKIYFGTIGKFEKRPREDEVPGTSSGMFG